MHPDSTPKLMLPIIHLNGSSAESLLADYRAALEKVADAMEALQKTCPNSRDYYVSQDAGAYVKARDEHIARCRAIQQVYDEMMVLAIHCADNVRS